MLILAGVSLNAIVGDNGIITNAQNANMKNGMAALEEFLQEKYVENFDNFTSDDSNKVAKLSALYHEYFYNPQDDGFGTVNYILDAEGHALYLINKSGLPEDVQELLHAGNCGYGLEGADRYAAFARLEDVYGVTSSLKVYYVSGDGTFMGIASKNDLDDDTTSRVVLRSSNALAGAIKNDGSDVTVADIQSVKNLTINETNSISSLSDLYALGSLESLTLDGVTLNNLDGIQTAAKLSYVYIKNSIIDDGNDSTYKEYESLAKVAKLKYLYFYSVNDTDLEKICEGIKNANYPNLEYLAFMGRASYVCSTDDKINGARNSEKSLTNLLPLSKLSSSCVGNVKYLSIQSNDISDTTSVENGITITKYALENLVNFSDLYLLRVERNKLTSLKGLEDKSNLRYLYAGYNQLGINEEYLDLITVTDDDGEREATEEDKGKNSDNALYALQSKSNLYYVYLQGNLQIKWVSYLSGDTQIKYLYFGDGSKPTEDCLNMIDSEVASLRTILFNCGTNKSCPGKYWLSLLDENDANLDVTLENQEIRKGQFETLGTYKNIKYLSLKNVNIIAQNESGVEYTVLEQSEINNLATGVLNQITNLQYLNLMSSTGKSFSNFNDLSFLKGIKENDSKDDIDLKELRVGGTRVSTKEEKVINGETQWIDYDKGLKMLVTNRYNSSTVYCSNLVNLGINEEHINLGDLTPVIERISAKTSVEWSHWFYNIKRVYTDSGKVLKTLENCVGLTKLVTTGAGNSKDIVNLDLTGLTSLTSIQNSENSFYANVKLPASCKYVALYHGRIVDFSLLDEITYICFGGANRENVISSLSTIKSGCVVEAYTTRMASNMNGDKCFSIFEEVYKNRKENLILHKLSDYHSSSIGTALESLDGLAYISDLVSIRDVVNAMPNLRDISALGRFANTLERIELSNCSISDVSVISSLTKLTFLDLQNNCLAPYVEKTTTQIVNGEEQNTTTKWFTIKEVCTRMSTNAGTGTVTLKLAGNDSIIDWSYYTNPDNAKHWDKDSNYGS